MDLANQSLTVQTQVMPNATQKPNDAFKNGIPTRCLHTIQHYLLMQGIHAVTTGSPISLHKANVFFQYYKNFNVRKRLIGKALCLLQTQYAKKPKSPV